MPSRGVLPGDGFNGGLSWGKADTVGNLTEGFNVLSITDGGIGIITFTWDRDFGTIQYTVLGAAQFDQGSGAFRGVAANNTTPPAAGAALLATVDAAGNLADPNYTFVLAVGKGY